MVKEEHRDRVIKIQTTYEVGFESGASGVVLLPATHTQKQVYAVIKIRNSREEGERKRNMM